VVETDFYGAAAAKNRRFGKSIFRLEVFQIVLALEWCSVKYMWHVLQWLIFMHL
jgi:hypothetical protein